MLQNYYKLLKYTIYNFSSSLAIHNRDTRRASGPSWYHVVSWSFSCCILSSSSSCFFLIASSPNLLTTDFNLSLKIQLPYVNGWENLNDLYLYCDWDNQWEHRMHSHFSYFGLSDSSGFLFHINAKVSVADDFLHFLMTMLTINTN